MTHFKVIWPHRENNPEVNETIKLITGAQPKAGTGHKMQSISVVFSTLHCEGYTADLRYIACSLLLGVFAGSLKSYPPFWKARDSLLGNDTFPNLYDALVYGRKFKSEYLGRQIYERLPKREPSIVKLIQNRSDLWTFRVYSIVKFIENQSEHLSKLTLYHLKNVLQGNLDMLVNRAKFHCYF